MKNTNNHVSLPFATVLVAAAALAAPAPSLVAGNDENGATIQPAQEQNDNVTHSLALEFFYGLACDDLYDKYGVSIDADTFGPQMRYTVTPKGIFGNSSVYPEFFVLAGFGAGYGSDEGFDVSVINVRASIGANIKMDVSDSVSAFARAQVGLDYESIDLDYYSYCNTNDDLGFLYGVGVGVQIALRDKTPSSMAAHSVTIGVDYIGSTAEPEFKSLGVEADEQSYIVLSVGYRLDF